MNANHSGYGRTDTLSEISGLQTQFDVFRFLKRSAELFGFRYFTVLRMPSASSQDLSENSIITNWPAEFLHQFDTLKLLRNSPVVERMRGSVLPFCFSYQSLLKRPDILESDAARALYEIYAYWSGVCIPVHDPQGDRAAVILSGDRDALGHSELSELTLLAIHLYQRLADVTKSDTRQDQSLTQRELDCLTWTAAGKTSADIAQILELSEHTVNHYLNRAAKKLDTVNRTQAVAKALKRRLIY